MSESIRDFFEREEPEPRWPAFVALVSVGLLFLALPPSLSLGPPWLLGAIVAALVIPNAAMHRIGKHHIDRVIGFVVSAVVTLFMATSVVLLIRALPEHREEPDALLRSAIALWVTNVLVFALWYWRLDAGGPHGRDKRRFHTDGAFLFPQMTLDPDLKAAMDETDWSPNFVDYLFLAFNVSTALSPTDAPVLSRWAKILMMLQAMISLAIVALLAARAVNIL
jgi:hypothetical protein